MKVCFVMGGGGNVTIHIRASGPHKRWFMAARQRTPQKSVNGRQTDSAPYRRQFMKAWQTVKP